MRKTMTKLKSTKGITLIALVITIIVLLILAGVAISMLSGENGILNQAANAKTETEKKSIEEQVKLAAMDALMRGNNVTSIESVEDLNNALKSQGVSEQATENKTEDGTVTGYTVKIGEEEFSIKGNGEVKHTDNINKEPILNVSGIIPENATYKVAEFNGICSICNFDFTSNSSDETCYCQTYSRANIGSSQTLIAGDSFPVTTKNGDTFNYGDYTYTYYSSWYAAPTGGGAGWCVNEVTDKSKTKYSQILGSINGQSVVSLQSTFLDCTEITDLSDFLIPNSIEKARDAFKGCTKLTKIPKFSSKMLLLNAFENCNLTNNIDLSYINEELVLASAFNNCKNIVEISLPKNVQIDRERFFYL